MNEMYTDGRSPISLPFWIRSYLCVVQFVEQCVSRVKGWGFNSHGCHAVLVNVCTHSIGEAHVYQNVDDLLALHLGDPDPFIQSDLQPFVHSSTHPHADSEVNNVEGEV